jgi:methionyl-tRNA formyltransferase
LKLKVQNDKEATYFGKRTPEDGEINWDWEKEDIKNWVRAQANPYPGAFTFYNNQKIIIDKVSFSKVKINNEQSNGEIIQVKPSIIVKTKNGAVKIDLIRTENYTFDQGNKFGNENW